MPLLGVYQTGVAVTSVASFITSFINVLASETYSDDDKLCDDEKYEADELENDEQDGAQIGVIVRHTKKTQSAPNWLDYSNNETKEAMEKYLKKFKLLPIISTVLLCIQMF